MAATNSSSAACARRPISSEFHPFVLILLAGLEASGYAATWLWVVGVIYMKSDGWRTAWAWMAARSSWAG